MTRFFYSHLRASPRGFTLIELLTTLALAAILASLAAPSVRDFIVRSKLNQLGNEFTGSILKARNEAVNRNTCVTLCMSSSADAAAPVCSSTGADWQVGWIAFLNPGCNSSATEPAEAINMLLARPSTGTDYRLQARQSKIRMTFNARGAPGITDIDQFDLIYMSTDDPLTRKYAFNICMDGLGRTRSIPADKTCANYE